MCAPLPRRVTISPDTRVPNAATLVIEREDHTLGNMLRMRASHYRTNTAAAAVKTAPRSNTLTHTASRRARRQLLEDTEVTFGGYRVQHPLEPSIQVKVQTRSENPGPVQAVEEALGSLLKEVEVMEKGFKKSFDKQTNKGAKGAKATGSDGFGDAMQIG